MTFSLNPFLSQNYQVHTCESVEGIPLKEDPGTSSIYPLRDDPDLLPSFLPLPQSRRVSGEREKKMSGVANVHHLSFFHIAALLFPCLDQVPSFTPSNMGQRIPNVSKGFYVTCTLVLGTGLFLFERD